jgi:hypothetical protein
VVAHFDAREHRAEQRADDADHHEDRGQHVRSFLPESSRSFLASNPACQREAEDAVRAAETR